MIQNGSQTQRLTYTDLSSAYLEADLSVLAGRTKFPFYLIIPQPLVETILESHALSLGIPIHWNTKVAGLRQLDQGGFQVTLESGHSIKAKHIIGADGSRSTVSGVLFNTLL